VSRLYIGLLAWFRPSNDETQNIASLHRASLVYLHFSLRRVSMMWAMRQPSASFTS
jgi:hypothetical protein